MSLKKAVQKYCLFFISQKESLEILIPKPSFIVYFV